MLTHAALLPNESLRRGVFYSERSLLTQISKFVEIYRDAEPQAKKAQESLEILILQVEEQVLRPMKVVHGDDAIPVRVHLKEGRVGVLESKTQRQSLSPRT